MSSTFLILCSKMYARRPSTSSPISIRKYFSASTASLSVTFNGQLADPPVTGEIVENIGDPLPFEQPLWARHSPHGEQRIPFHPLDFGEAALAAILGLPYARGVPDPVEYGTVPLAGFRVTALPGSAAEAEERKAEAATRRHARAQTSRALPARNCPRWIHPVDARRLSRLTIAAALAAAEVRIGAPWRA